MNGHNGVQGRGLVGTWMPIDWAPCPWVVSTTVLTPVRKFTEFTIAGGVIIVTAGMGGWPLLGSWRERSGAAAAILH